MTKQEMMDRYIAVPEELKGLKAWAGWSGRRNDDGTVDMTACNPMAEDPTVVEHPAELLTFEEAAGGCALNGFAGLGIMLPSPYACITVVGGKAHDMCSDIVARIDSYTEDAHGKGDVQILFRSSADIADKTTRHPEIGRGVEVRIGRGFVPLTGKAYHGAGMPVTDASRDVRAVISSYISAGGIKIGDDSDYDMTDTGNARRLRDVYGDQIRYSHTMGEWYVWDGKRWAPNDAGQIKQLADNVIGGMRAEAAKIQDSKARESAIKFIRKTESHTGKENMLKECQHLEGIPVKMDDLDNDDVTAGLINCQNGVIDLRTGELRPHDKSLMMTKICSCEYDVKHRRPDMFLRFLDDITRGDKDMQTYIKRCMGYTLTGSGSEQCAFFLYGMGNNGKSTLADTISAMLGTYAANTQADTLLLKGREVGGGGATSDIARLKSVRMVTCQEPDEGARIKEGLLKQLTGNTDKITARFLYGREFEFYPRFAAWISANHKPIVRGTDKGIWRRIRLVPFEVDIQNPDKELPRKLRDELPQILAWAVEGAIEWYEHGLETPAAVSTATAEYKKEMDLVQGFVDACLEIDYNTSDIIMSSDMFAVYIAWARANNEYEMTSKKFAMELAKKIPDGSKGRKGAGVYYGKLRFSEYGRQFVTKKYTADQFK